MITLEPGHPLTYSVPSWHREASIPTSVGLTEVWVFILFKKSIEASRTDGKYLLAKLYCIYVTLTAVIILADRIVDKRGIRQFPIVFTGSPSKLASVLLFRCCLCSLNVCVRVSLILFLN